MYDLAQTLRARSSLGHRPLEVVVRRIDDLRDAVIVAGTPDRGARLWPRHSVQRREVVAKAIQRVVEAVAHGEFCACGGGAV